MKYRNITNNPQSFFDGEDNVIVKPNRTVETEIDLGGQGCYEKVEEIKPKKKKEVS